MYSQTRDGAVKNWMSFFPQHTASKSQRINNKESRIFHNISHAANTHVSDLQKRMNEEPNMYWHYFTTRWQHVTNDVLALL